ncbi:MAG: winged helix-turn-helix transcriptional regulator [Candidatus Pacebacteria bacterium]|nr:winged helix-turn-helix transcriptional regulator [Candidatus Paceibacterota bacterium]
MKKIHTLEVIIKGFANERRISVLLLLHRYPNSSIGEIADALKIGYKSVSQHVDKMYRAGLVSKEGDGYFVLHTLTIRGKQILYFLRKLC